MKFFYFYFFSPPCWYLCKNHLQLCAFTGGSYFNLTLSYSNRAQRGETSLRYNLISSPPHTLLYSMLQWPTRTKLGIKSGVRNNILSWIQTPIISQLAQLLQQQQLLPPLHCHLQPQTLRCSQTCKLSGDRWCKNTLTRLVDSKRFWSEQGQTQMGT